MPPIATSCLFAAVAAVGIPAQTTLLVGANGLPDVAAALALAAPGDRIDVEPGTYPPFQAAVGVTIRAIQHNTVEIRSSPMAPPQLLTANVPAGQVLHLVGLRLGQPFGVLGGRVTLDRCDCRSSTTPLLVSNATVHLQDSEVFTGLSLPTQPALSITNSDLTAIGTWFDSSQLNTAPAPVIDANGARLHMSHCTVRLQAFGPVSGAALRLLGGSQAWLSDSAFNLLISPTSSFCAVAGVASTVRIDRCTGWQTTNPACLVPAAGATLVGVDRSGPLSPGGTFGLDFRAQPSGFVLVFASPQLGTVNWQPILEQPSWLDETQSFSTELLLTDAVGAASVAWQLPASPAIVGQTLWFKGISGFTFPLQGSPAVGGVAR
jgi:hypothetical protein